MKKTIASLTLLLLLSSLLTGCGSDTAPLSSSNNDGVTTVALGETVTIDGSGASADGQVVTIDAGGTYVVSGTLTDGQILVTAQDAVTLQLAGVDITNSAGPAILFEQSVAGQIILRTATENILSDSGDAEYDGALYSTSSLTISGDGSLIVNGNNQEGIASEEHITIDGGQIRIISADDGINANQDGVSLITINGGYLYIDAAGDGIDSNGSLTINGGTVISMSALTDMSGGIDVDGDFTLNGGTVLATGAMNSQPNAASSQAALSFSFKTTQEAGTLFQILSADQTLLIAAPEKAYQTLLYSSANVAADGSYTIYAGGICDGSSTDGIYANGSCSDSIQQTHRTAATAGEFIATGSLNIFDSVTYLTDTDFTSQISAGFGGFGRGNGQRPEGQSPQDGNDRPDGQVPPNGERPEGRSGQPPEQPTDSSNN